MCDDKMCQDKLCVSKLCEDKVCVSKLCVEEAAGGGGGGRRRRDTEPKTRTPHKDVRKNLQTLQRTQRLHGRHHLGQ